MDERRERIAKLAAEESERIARRFDAWEKSMEEIRRAASGEEPLFAPSLEEAP